MYPPPAGPNLTAEQRRELDDTFLSSDPFQYFSARTGMLLHWEERSSVIPEAASSLNVSIGSENSTSSRAGLRRLLGQTADSFPGIAATSVTGQIATDAYALRHHAAESLVRLANALLANSDRSDMCIWEALSTGPIQINQTVAQLRASLSSPDASGLFTQLVIREQDLKDGITEAHVAAASSVFGAWLEFAISLLASHDRQLDAAHNKIKHGLAVRTRDDLLLAFTTVPPNKDGTIPLSGTTGPNVINILDRPVIEVLAQAPKANGHRQGLELTQLRIDIAEVLAEAYMLAWAHGAIFHVAAAKHFEGRPGFPEYLHAPNHPGYPLKGPRPEHISTNGPIAMRFPLTSPPGGGPCQRPTALLFRDSLITMTITGSPIRNATIVADEEPEE